LILFTFRQYQLIRSPEEIAVKLKQTKRGDVLLEKSDVYTLGNVMYYVFTMQWLFQGLDAADAAKKVTEGIRSPFPQKLLESPDRAIRAMRKAIEMCWTHDPEKRPTADEVRKFLGHELKAVLGVEELGVVRVTSIEPLPSGYSYTDSDFSTMFEDSDEDSDD
jgi:serine/threonine protein kinase